MRLTHVLTYLLTKENVKCFGLSLEETQVDNSGNRWRVGDQLSCVVSLEETQVENRWRVGDQRSCVVSLEETQVENRWRVGDQRS